MVRDCANLSSLAEAEIEALRAEGIEPTPAEVVRINWLAWAVESPGHRLLLARGIPVAVGGVTLWPLTMRGSDWFQRVGLSMPAGIQDAALAYAMAHGRADGRELDAAGRDAEKAVVGWRRGLRCTRGELTEALAQVIDQGERDEQPPRRDDAGELSAGELSAFLAAACGGPPEVWERQCSLSYGIGVLRAVVAQNRADDKPVAGDERMAANRALGWAIEEIRKAHGKGATSDGA